MPKRRKRTAKSSESEVSRELHTESQSTAPAPEAQPLAASGSKPTALGRAVFDRTWIHLALITIASVLVFANTLPNSFHMDDGYLVQANRGIHQVSRPWVHFVDPTTQSTLPVLRGYRPLLPLTLSINYAIAGDSFPGYHIGNLLIHLAASWVLYLLLVQLLTLAPATKFWPKERTSIRSVALCASLLFALHPVSGFSINYISGRDQPLSVLFWCASLLVYVRMRAKRFSAAGWLACFALLILSLMAKMYAAVAPAVILWLELTIFREPLTKLKPWLRAGAFVIPIVALFAFQLLAIGYLPEFSNNLSGGGLKFDVSYPLTQARLHLFRYIPNFFWTLPIRVDPLEPPSTSIDWKVAAGCLFIAGTLAAAWYYRRREPLLAFCIVAYWLMLVVSSSIAPLYYLAADYRPYPSSPFLFLPLCLLALKLVPVLRKTIAVGAIAWCAATSIYLNTTWRTDVSLYTHSIAYGGGWLAYHNLAIASSDMRARRMLLEQALRINPHYDMAMLNLGRTLIHLGDKKKGLEWLERVRAWNPKNPLVRYWYARTMIELDRKQDAARESDATAQLDPSNVKAVYQAAETAMVVNDRKRASYWFDVARALEPDGGPNDFALGWGFQQLGRNRDAIAVYERFLKANPNHAQVRFNLGFALMKEKDCPAAIPEFQRVLALEPTKASAHLHIANCSKQAGDTVLAQVHQKAWEQSQKRR